MERRERPSTLKSSCDNVCPVCGGTGFMTYKKKCPEVYGKDVKWEADFSAPCTACNGGLVQRAETAKRNSNIPPVYSDKNYKDFEWDVYMDSSGNVIEMSKKRKLVESLLKDYDEWKKRGLGLYIYSKTKGSGKTFLASCICNELMSLYGIRTRFVSATQLLEISKSGDKGSDEGYKRDPVKVLCDCGVLVIDDIGQKKTGYDWMNEVLFRIIDERMTKSLVTIFTSNQHINELVLDERIVERINKMSIGVALPEYNVRARESYNEKLQFMREMGLMEGGGG